MKISIKKGFSFGLTSGIITTLGLIVGLHSSTHSTPVIIGGILVIAIADALSDALGMHISEESENKHSNGEIWQSTVVTFLAKFFFALTFIMPIWFFSLSTAIIISVVWGLLILGILSFYIGKNAPAKTWRVVIEHLVIALIVIVATHFVGDWVGEKFQ
jgi:VIT1/CCC1 family predicted Fe2+/Mn2+ transporter